MKNLEQLSQLVIVSNDVLIKSIKIYQGHNNGQGGVRGQLDSLEENTGLVFQVQNGEWERKKLWFSQCQAQKSLTTFIS